MSAINACSGKQAGNFRSFTRASQSKQSRKSSFSSPKKSLSLSWQGQADPWTLGCCKRCMPGTEGTGVWQGHSWDLLSAQASLLPCSTKAGKCLLPQAGHDSTQHNSLWHASQHTDHADLAGCIMGSISQVQKKPKATRFPAQQKAGARAALHSLQTK